MKIEPIYLGDGVYASFDGYHICLQVGDHRNPTVVALEDDVLDALARYRQHIIDERTKEMDADLRKGLDGSG